jgi:uncharacterized protein YodC (DUF2158 family)
MRQEGDTMTTEFKPGDIVRLKSGGPDMTVSSIDPHKKYLHCEWFAGKKREFGQFSFVVIEAVSRADSGQ